MDIRKTASYPVAVPTPPRRTRPETVEPVDPPAAWNAESPVPSTTGQARSRPVDAAQDTDGGRPRSRADDDAVRVERQTALNAKARQALQAYLSHERFAQQESRTALNQSLGVDYYA